MGASAERAYSGFAPTLLGDEITATLVIVEVVDDGDKGIEVFKCKSHGMFLLAIYLYHKSTDLFQINPSFFA